MRVMVIVKANKESEAGILPDQKAAGVDGGRPETRRGETGVAEPN